MFREQDPCLRDGAVLGLTHPRVCSWGVEENMKRHPSARLGYTVHGNSEVSNIGGRTRCGESDQDAKVIKSKIKRE